MPTLNHPDDDPSPDRIAEIEAATARLRKQKEASERRQKDRVPEHAYWSHGIRGGQHPFSEDAIDRLEKDMKP